MKTLSVKQPWAYLICSGIKDIENRTWKTKFRGRVLIHASGKPDKEPYMLFNDKQVDSIGDYDIMNVVASYGCLGTIIGSVEIVDCVIDHSSVWAEKSIDCKECPDVEECPVGKCPHLIYNWVLANPIMFDSPIVDVKGKLGLWDYELNNK